MSGAPGLTDPLGPKHIGRKAPPEESPVRIRLEPNRTGRQSTLRLAMCCFALLQTFPTVAESQGSQVGLQEEPAFSRERGGDFPAALEEAAPEGLLSVAFDPLNPGVVYAGTRGWGLAKSLDRGYSWSSVGPELEGLSITSIAIHPNGRVVYVGSQSQGVFRSIHGGITFQNIQVGLPDPEIRDLEIHPFNPLTLFAGTAAGLAWSQDGGNTWRAFPGAGGGPSEVVDIELSLLRRQSGREEPADAESTRPDRDSGSPYVLLATGDDAVWGCDYQPSCRPILDRERMAPMLVEALAGDGGDPRLALEVLARPQPMTLAVAPSDPEVIYAGSPTGIFRSTDRGLSWVGFFGIQSIKGLGVHPDDPRWVWAATDRGLWLSRDAGQTFQQIDTGHDLRLTVLAIDPSDPGILFAGSDDGRLLVGENGAFRTVSLRSQQVTSDPGPPAPGPRLGRIPARSAGSALFGPHIDQMLNVLIADPRFPHIHYAGTRTGVFRSRDQGRSWSGRRQGIGDLDIFDLVVDPADSYSRHPEEEATLIAATNGSGVFISKTSGRSWQRVERGPGDPVVRTLALDPADSDFVVAGTRDRGIFRSVDGGRNWTPALEQPTQPGGIPERGIRDLAIEGDRVLAATDWGGIFTSRDRGLTWQRLASLSIHSDSDLAPLKTIGIYAGALHVNALALHPDRNGWIHAATPLGIFRSEDGGEQWRRVLAWHNGAVLTHHPSQSDVLVAGTAQGIAFSRDAGETWDLRVLRDPISAAEFDPVYGSRVFAGNDHGESIELDLDLEHLERRRAPRPKVHPPSDRGQIPLTKEARYEAGWEDPRRDLRRRALAWLATAPDHELGIENMRTMALLALESHLRGETAISSDPEVDLTDAAGRLMKRQHQLQEQYVSRWGVERVSVDPTSRLLAVEYRWDDGARERSEIRVFDLRRSSLYRPSAFSSVGPTVWWKELHDRFRRPESWEPQRVLSGAGRFLGWSVDGSTLISQNDWDQVTLWPVGADTQGAGEAKTFRGLSSPVLDASMDPSGTLLAIVGLDGRPLWIDVRSGSRRLLTRDVLDGGIRHVAMTSHGVLTAGADGTVRRWPLEGPDTVLVSESEGFDHVERSPDGRWWLLGRNNERRGEREDGLWGRVHLMDLTDPDLTAYRLGEGQLWSGIRWSPDQRWAALSHGTQGSSLLVSLTRNETRSRPPAAFEVGSSPYLHFDPLGDLVITSNALWVLGQTPQVYEEKPRASPLARFDRPEAQGFWRLFGLRPPEEESHGFPTALSFPWLDGQTPNRYTALPPGFHQELHSPDGRWLLGLDRRGRLAMSYFDTETRRSRQDEIRRSTVVGAQLVSLRRHQLPESDGSGSRSPADHWPLSLTGGARWDVGSFGDFLSWGCALAGRNLSTREWQRFFGDEPHKPTCRFPRKAGAQERVPGRPG